MDKKIYLSPPNVGNLESDLVLEAMLSGWVAPAGPFLQEFEESICRVSGRSFAVALNSGTSALHLGLIALGVGEDDIVLCSSMTFVATANTIRYVGASPVFIDSEPGTGNISVSLLKEAIQTIKSSGKSVAAIVTVDFLGCVADYPDILSIAEENRIPVLVDAAESLGATLNEKPAGSFGQAAIFSFNGNKIATTGGGGAIVTDNPDIAEKVRFLSRQAKEPVAHYEHKEVGYNYRLSNVLAAIGVGQLRRLQTLVASRRSLRLKYKDIFGSVAGISFLGRDENEDNCWLTAIVVDHRASGFSNLHLSKALESANIESRRLWKPMHLQPLYSRHSAFTNGISEGIFMDGLAMPSGSSVDSEDWKRIESTLSTFLFEQGYRS